jgi:RNA polymerase sigma factor (sigma-70 family)
MPGGTSREVLKDLRTLFRFGVVGDMSDGALLDQFVARRDQAAEEAFATLVGRHGPMVLGVCRRVLNDSHEAEDAFQATFLVLARKAATIARRETLASWLYGVALRTAKDARGRKARRKAREERATVADHVEPAADEVTGELRSILDEELARLPERFRLAVLLCELEGLSRQEASSRLGIPEGTLSSRLARAKAILRDRLARRGLLMTTMSLTAALAHEAQAVALPFALAESTTRAATLVAAGSSLAGLVSSSVHSLTEEVLKAMLLAKLKGIALGLITVGVVVTGAVLAQSPGPGTGPALQPRVADHALNASDSDRLRAVEQKLDRILEAIGRSRPTPEPPRSQPPSSVSADTVTFRAEPVPVPPPGGANFVPPTTGYAVTAAPPGDRNSRLANLERRLAEVERRLTQLERRLDTGQPPPPAGPPLVPSTIQPPAALPATTPGAASAATPSPF